MSQPEAPVLQFPCPFPVKVFYHAQVGIEAEFEAVLRQALGPAAPISQLRHASSQGRYACLTLTFEAQSAEQVHQVGQLLKQHPAVLMAL